MDAELRMPRQDRSRRSLEAVLDAGVALLAERGYDDLSIADVSARSGVSVGSIYQRFGSKAVLFSALQRRILATIDAEQQTLFADLDAGAMDDGAIVEAAVSRIAGEFRRHEPLIRVMILRGAVDEEARARGSLSSRALAETFAHFLRGSVRRFGHEDPAVACDIAFRIVYAALTRRIMSGPTFESGMETPWEIFVAELARACRAYLVGAPRPRR